MSDAYRGPRCHPHCQPFEPRTSSRSAAQPLAPAVVALAVLVASAGAVDGACSWWAIVDLPLAAFPLAVYIDFVRRVWTLK